MSDDKSRAAAMERTILAAVAAVAAAAWLISRFARM